jgi:hypothetical protein
MTATADAMILGGGPTSRTLATHARGPGSMSDRANAFLRVRFADEYTALVEFKVAACSELLAERGATAMVDAGGRCVDPEACAAASRDNGNIS